MRASQNYARARAIQLQQQMLDEASRRGRRNANTTNLAIQGLASLPGLAVDAAKSYGQARTDQQLAQAKMASTEAPAEQRAYTSPRGELTTSERYRTTPQQQAESMFAAPKKTGDFWKDLGSGIDDYFAAPGRSQARALAAQRIAEQRAAGGKNFRALELEKLGQRNAQRAFETGEAHFKAQQQAAADKMKADQEEAARRLQLQQDALRQSGELGREKIRVDRERNALTRQAAAERRKAAEDAAAAKEKRKALEARGALDRTKMVKALGYRQPLAQQMGTVAAFQDIASSLDRLRDLRASITGGKPASEAQRILRGFIKNPDYVKLKAAIDNVNVATAKMQDPSTGVKEGEVKRVEAAFLDPSLTEEDFDAVLGELQDQVRSRHDSFWKSLDASRIYIQPAGKIPFNDRDFERTMSMAMERAISAGMPEDKAAEYAENVANGVKRSYEENRSRDPLEEAFLSLQQQYKEAQ